MLKRMIYHEHWFKRVTVFEPLDLDRKEFSTTVRVLTYYEPTSRFVYDLSRARLLNQGHFNLQIALDQGPFSQTHRDHHIRVYIGGNRLRGERSISFTNVQIIQCLYDCVIFDCDEYKDVMFLKLKSESENCKK